MNDTTFRCLMVRSSESDSQKKRTTCEIETASFAQLQEPFEPDAEPMVRIRIKFSSLNYKDALATQGHPGVAKQIPLIPGIDAAGTVESTTGQKFQAGDEVIVFHARFGTEHNGAYSDIAWVPESWVYLLPQGLSLRESMIIGTAGFTAAQCVDELTKHGIKPTDGPIVVSGATGGVGIFAVKILSTLGYQVVASTGKPERKDWLLHHGAADVISRDALNDSSDRPLLKSEWAGAVDAVGGNTLATILRATQSFGCVTACGLVGGTDLNLTVYPFILRGVTLQGIDTANIDYSRRQSLWKKLAGPWRPGSAEDLDSLAVETDLDGLTEQASSMLNGGVAGRVIVRL